MVTVLAHGCWDLLHPGHLEHLRQARAMGDKLVVSVTADAYLAKGPGRPVYGEAQRMEMLRSLRCVDEVFLCEDPSALPAIERFQPALYVKGADYASRPPGQGKLALEKAAVEEHGGRLAFTEATAMSTTTLLNNANGRPIARTPQEIIAWLDKAAQVPMHFLGEVIIDKYVYVHPEFKSPKENVITYREVGSHSFDGGLLMVMNHMGLERNAALSDVGQQIVKQRYVTMPFYTKVFSTVAEHEVPPFFVPNALPSPLLVADYGHGLVRGKARAKQIADRVEYLILMVQSNSLNWGYNLLTKWPRADYFVVDELELRLARSDRWTPIEDLLVEEHGRLRAKIGAVTLGHEGCVVYDGREMVKLPALASKVVDRLGAGDAFLAWTARLAVLDAPADIIAFVGSVAAGIQVGIVGNEKPVDGKIVRQWVKGLLG